MSLMNDSDSMLNVTHLRRRRRQVFSSDNIVGVVSNVPMMSTPCNSPRNDTINISSSAILYPIRQQHAKQRQQLHSSPSLSPPPIITITHECLLIPVAFGLWWYWTKRTARKVYKSLLRIAPACSEEQEDDNDDLPDLSIHNQYYHYNYNHNNASISSPNHTTNKYHTDNDVFQSWNDVEASCQKYPTNSSTSSNPHDTTTTQSSSGMRWVRWIKSSSAPLTGSSTSRKERQVRIMTLQNLRQQQQQQNRTTSVRSIHATSPTSPIQALALSPPITQQQEYHTDPYPSSWECIPDTTTTHPFTSSSSSASTFTTSFYQHMEDLCFVQPSNPTTTTTTAVVAGTTGT
jgi:hypothetical protein